MNWDHLIDAARVPAGTTEGTPPGRPRQVMLKRALTTAYYTMFHALCKSSADLTGTHFAEAAQSLRGRAGRRSIVCSPEDGTDGVGRAEGRRTPAGVGDRETNHATQKAEPSQHRQRSIRNERKRNEEPPGPAGEVDDARAAKRTARAHRRGSVTGQAKDRMAVSQRAAGR